MEYRIKYTDLMPDLNTGFDDGCWLQAETGRVDHFHPKSSDYHPEVRFRMLYNEYGLYLKYAVRDRYVLARCTRFQDIVCCDSCVEFLVKPDSGKGYVSFEMNCIGTLLSYHIIDPTRCDVTLTARYFREYRPLTEADLDGFTIRPTLTAAIPSELTEPVDYEVSLFIPFKVFCRTVGAAVPAHGSVWNGNFFKCADGSSHPHWAAWTPLGSELNFHQVGAFEKLIFE